jgi:hypothetical protein
MIEPQSDGAAWLRMQNCSGSSFAVYQYRPFVAICRKIPVEIRPPENFALPYISAAGFLRRAIKPLPPPFPPRMTRIAKLASAICNPLRGAGVSC